MEAATVTRPLPVLKWAGGKGRLLAQYESFFPESFNRYFEPFLGSGAVFFHLRHRYPKMKAVLSDTNAELIHFYTVLRDQLEPLADKLEEHARLHSHDHYYEVRAQNPDELDGVARAARLGYLNKTCYNGLYRVNSKGKFNVPLGRYKKPTICNRPKLEAASSALRGAELKVAPFQKVLKRARTGDLVYFDPPYEPLNHTSNFTSYTRDNFTAEDQARLSVVFRKLGERGVKVMLSNSTAPLIKDLYSSFTQHQVEANRFINSKASKRNKIKELLILGPEL